ncbi:hypothetical protein [Mycoplasma sp. P36-A1]|uniref:hypothetical protein n=1 Tax=Mycoplasma sp. P36-A1 TaxID=3252900 RepID=UPI003C2DA468
MLNLDLLIDIFFNYIKINKILIKNKKHLIEQISALIKANMVSNQDVSNEYDILKNIKIKENQIELEIVRKKEKLIFLIQVIYISNDTSNIKLIKDSLLFNEQNIGVKYHDILNIIFYDNKKNDIVQELEKELQINLNNVILELANKAKNQSINNQYYNYLLTNVDTEFKPLNDYYYITI